MRFNDYANEISELVARYTRPGENSKLRREEKSKLAGKVQTRLDKPLVLENGGYLSFFESIVITIDKKVDYLAYTYSYTHVDGYFFRYDKAPDHYKKYAHEVCHLHANREDIRYPTHSITLEEVLGFIIATFP